MERYNWKDFGQLLISTTISFLNVENQGPEGLVNGQINQNPAPWHLVRSFSIVPF